MRHRPIPAPLTRRAALLLALSPLALGVAPRAAAEAPTKGPAKNAPQYRLILVEQKGCPGCEAWLREIGPTYAQNAPEVPLTRVDVHTGRWPEGIAIGARPNATPTFLILRDGIEIDRLYGFAGAKRFWTGLREAIG